MDKRAHFYVSRKNGLTWLMAACMVCSAVARIWLVGMKGTGESVDVWSQIVLPIAAVLLYAAICVLNGKERFYKTAIAEWLLLAYYAFNFSGRGLGSLVSTLHILVLIFAGFLYAQITCGRERFVPALLLLQLFPLAVECYLDRSLLLSGNYLPLLPDALATLGLVLVVFAIRLHPAGEYHPTWGDRTDGRRIRTEPPMNQVSPYIMVTRNTSSNLFADAIEITQIERYIRKKRKEGLTNFGLMHVLLAAYCRSLCKYPKLNRFIGGQKIYSRGNDVQFCMTIKKEMLSDAPETVIKVHLSPSDTSEDIYNKVNAEIEKVKNTPLDSGFDNTAQLLTFIPGVFLKFVVWLLRTLDYFGLLPKFLLEVSPFHGSVFFTSMGSLGIPPIYHHLYDFGNLPVFGSFGCKRRELEVQEDGTVVQRKYMDVKFTLDERICDGFYYATFFKTFKRLLRTPDVFDQPPEEILRDID